MITVPAEKCPLFNFILQMLKEIVHIYQRKINNQELRSQGTLKNENFKNNFLLIHGVATQL